MQDQVLRRSRGSSRRDYGATKRAGPRLSAKMRRPGQPSTQLCPEVEEYDTVDLLHARLYRHRQYLLVLYFMNIPYRATCSLGAMLDFAQLESWGPWCL